MRPAPLSRVIAGALCCLLVLGVGAVAVFVLPAQLAPRSAFTSAGDAIRAQSPFNRVAAPEEIAAAVVYLASPEAAWSSGAVLDLNGASYLR